MPLTKWGLIEVSTCVSSTGTFGILNTDRKYGKILIPPSAGASKDILVVHLLGFLIAYFDITISLPILLRSKAFSYH